MNKNNLDSLVGTKVLSCKFVGTRINLNPTTFSLCHEAQVGDKILGKIEDLSPDTYYDALYRLLKDNETENAHCRTCKRLQEQIFELKKITFITVNTSAYCNSSCIYCMSHFGGEGTGYNPIPYFEMLEKEALFAERAFFDWGGGEPTLNPYFEDSVRWIYEHGYKQRINTNAIIYSEAAEQALLGKMASLRISIDAGTEKCFAMMKGHENYGKVWENIKRYATHTDEIYIKYNVCNYNSEKQEIETFLYKCKEVGVKNILIDAEVCSYHPEKNVGPFYFTQKEFEAAHFLEKRAKEYGLCVQISWYGFSVRGEYDKEGNLCLPQKYFDNIDKEVLSAGIGVRTFPNVKYMLQYLYAKESPKAIWGMGIDGQQCYGILQKMGINVEYIIDSSEEKQKIMCMGKQIISPTEFFKKNVGAQVILCGRFWKEMLKEINEQGYNKGEILYMQGMHYHAYAKENLTTM